MFKIASPGVWIVMLAAAMPSAVHAQGAGMECTVGMLNPSRPMLNCGNSGAPENGSSGAGVCSIVSTGDPTMSYDGAPDAYGNATCDGASGRPASGTYGCGRRNVFQGRLGTPQSPGQLNALTFTVPFDPPG